MSKSPTILITGATGFVGSHLRVALDAAGWHTRLGTRRPAAARKRDPDGDWVELDIGRVETVAAALDGCRAAAFLVHGLGSGNDYPERERRAADAFSRAAADAGLERVVYMGGVAPAENASRHLGARLETGERLRAGAVPTIELRAAAIIGHGSTSWQMLRDLARRLPAMLLPRWLKRTSWPVAVDDVVAGLVAATCQMPARAGCFDLPGPERLTHRALLMRAAEHVGRTPLLIGVPVLSPRLSSYWIGLVTSVDFPVARELVEGLTADLEPTCELLGDHPAIAPPLEPTPLDLAMERALADEDVATHPKGGLSEATAARMVAIGRRWGANGSSASAGRS